MINRYFYDNFKRSGRLNDNEPDFRRRHSSLNVGTKHETGISILVAILLLISFYFIPFPINLILFIISLILFLIISFWVHIQSKRQSLEESSNNSYLPNRSSDDHFVDVPLEPITFTDNSIKPQFNRI